jgi:hypothetical protein
MAVTTEELLAAAVRAVGEELIERERAAAAGNEAL